MTDRLASSEAMEAPFQDVVLQLFERHRAAPGTPFEESRFLDFLLAHPKEKRAVHNSFSGLRRYNAFINDVQLHFSICFSLKDFEANYSLARFAQRVAELQASRRASLESLRNQKRHGFGRGTVFVVNLLALALVVGAVSISPAMGACIVLACALANGAVFLSFVRWRSYQKRLTIQLQSSGPNDA